jgi:hypothetical protein
MPAFTSTGQCYLCGETFNKRVMTRHLTKCLAEHPQKGKPRKIWLFGNCRGGRQIWGVVRRGKMVFSIPTC